MERITMLREPPIVGRLYLVPTINYHWGGGRTKPWPVFLPRHEDAEHLKYPWMHYHIDPRFLSRREWETVEARAHGTRYSGLGLLQAQPLMDTLTPDHGPITWRRRRCHHADIPYQHHKEPPIRQLQNAYAGRSCHRAKVGLICPHKRFPLGSIAPNHDGEIVCPIHGLRINAESGLVLPAKETTARPSAQSPQRQPRR